MKIGFVTTSLSSKDGWGRYSKSLVKAVSCHSEVKVLIEKKESNELDPSVPVYKTLPKYGFDIFTQLAVFLKIVWFLWDCDIIHSLVEPYSPAAALACLIFRNKLVVTMHGTYSVPPSNFGFQRYLMFFAYKVSSKTTTGSPRTEEKTRKVVKFGECRFIPNGVDDTAFCRLPDISAKNFILTVGALKPRKGADVVVKALHLLKEQFPSLRYKIVGSVDGEKFVEDLKKLIEEKGLKDRVDFTGRIGDRELAKLYNECSVFVLAARDIENNFEGFPMVYYEANICGAPVITTKGFGSEYAIKNGVNGYLVDPDNPEQVAEKISLILKDKNLREKLSANGIKEATNHTWDKVALKLLKFYQDTLDGK